MTSAGPLNHLLDRLAASHDGRVTVGADEAAQWPDGTLAALSACGLLTRAEPAQSVECDGCENHCFMPVHVLPPDGPRLARSFVVCDKREDVGRVPVALRRLEQWRLTSEALAVTVARLIGFATPPRADSKGKRWRLGLLQGREQWGEVTLAADGDVFLTLAEHQVPLVHVLTLSSSGISTDRDALTRIVDAAGHVPGNQSSRQARRDAEIQAKYVELAGRGKRNYVKEIQRTVPGAESLSERRIRDIAKGR